MSSVLEYLKNWPEVVVEALAIIFEDSGRSGKVSKNWKRDNTVLFLKGG